MSSRKKKRSRAQRPSSLIDTFTPPEEPLAGEDFMTTAALLVPEPPPAAEAPPDAPRGAEALPGPRCGRCGSTALHESSRGGVREGLLRLAGSTVYRCESCRRRFAYAALGEPGAHAASREPRAERPARRGKLTGLWVTALVALLTFLTAGWLISRAEQRRLEGESAQPAP